MTGEEWDQLEEEHFRSGLRLADVLARGPVGACTGVPAPLRRSVFAVTGRAYHVMWLLTRRGFARREAVAFAYLDRS